VHRRGAPKRVKFFTEKSRFREGSFFAGRHTSECAEPGTLGEIGDLTAVRRGGAKRSDEARPLSHTARRENVSFGNPVG
jgi:hypothetical protein